MHGESYPFGLRRRVVGEIIDVSFSVAVEKISENTGTTIPKRQVEELVGKADSSEDDALVVQARTVDDILAAEATPDASPVEAPRRPKPYNKRVWASVDKPLKAVVAEAFKEARARDPWLKRTWVYLVDFIHVLEYLWKAAWAFFDKGDPKAEKWVRQRARRVLQGQASQVVAGMRRSATRRDIPASTRKAVEPCADTLLNKKSMLRYEYLAEGLPIDTGVIEAAYRHLVADRMGIAWGSHGDRMGITAARWGLKGAQAVLRLRALKNSGDLDAYWDLHRQRELRRNHLSRFADAELPHLRRAA
ncbi:MAG: hypothetical protein GXP62_04730 [Oligoflexia bacterium]|nr:hypothetical protein [Oligoflexia bacterium]